MFEYTPHISIQTRANTASRIVLTLCLHWTPLFQALIHDNDAEEKKEKSRSLYNGSLAVSYWEKNTFVGGKSLQFRIYHHLDIAFSVGETVVKWSTPSPCSKKVIGVFFFKWRYRFSERSVSFLNSMALTYIPSFWKCSAIYKSLKFTTKQNVT